MSDSTFVWVRMRGSFKHGPGGWEYQELDLDGSTLEDEMSDALSQFDHTGGGDPEGFRKSQIEVCTPPEEWLKKECTRLFERASDLLDRRDRIKQMLGED